MAEELVQPAPVSIDSLTREELKKKSVDELEQLLQYMTSIRMTLMSKMELVHAVKEENQELEHALKDAAKMTPGKRAALAQVLGGEFIARDEKTSAGETTK